MRGGTQSRATNHESGESMRVVVKFGGTSLGNGRRVTRAADSIAAAIEAGHEVVVVASAMESAARVTRRPLPRQIGRAHV